ncbi:glycosyltransferase [Marinicella sp. S1101]|uniref:glycosyltransferase n=1 Tax=Marinicella marina TaxID=2996016 RepID=UPI0022609602|nr:glycosyltransferase [Marinicella marina]MCX7553229.1 glycosyltransferase [Marinicella marina]MDJ1138961.1 glycosyltransferase [Marinicella marina]
MFENVHIVSYNCAENKHSGFALSSTCDGFNDALKKQIHTAINDDNPIIIINNKAQLPSHWQTRLLQPMWQDKSIKLISALNISNHFLSPIKQRFNGSLLQLDSALFVLQKPHYFQTKSINDHCFAVSNKQVLAQQDIPRYAVNNLVVDVQPSTDFIDAPDFFQVGDQHPLPTHPLANIHLYIDELNRFIMQQQYPNIDGKPIALHVVMDWGGGVHQWLDHFIKDHNEVNHLVLVSHGEFYRQQHGEQFSLHWGGPDGLCIKTFQLAASIDSTVVQHTEYQHILNSIIKQWQVDLVVVSSLIGHAMDVLNTGLPTLRVLHDYFPHWPLLNAQLDADSISQDVINNALKLTANEPFGPISPEQLEQWQKAQNHLLAKDNIKLVAPDHSVKKNLLKLPHSDVYEKTLIIPHAIEKLDAINYEPSKEPFTVLVLGRISPPKGQNLIKGCIEAFSNQQDVQFILLGAGVVGCEFETLPNTEVIKDYDNDKLTETLQVISPQIAVLASQASETFSYTLSELQMSGIPVLATERGAFRNRIKAGVNGQFFANSVAQLAQAINTLKTDVDQLKTLSLGALETDQPELVSTKRAFQQLLPTDQAASQYHTFGLQQPNPTLGKLQQTLAECERLKQSHIAIEKNLEEKTGWAQDLSEHVKHLEQNIALNRDEIQKLSDKNTALKSQHIEQTKELITSVNEMKTHHDELIADNNQLLNEKQAAETQLDATQQQLQEMLNSRSWRITHPLRQSTTYLRHKRNAIRFRANQIKGLPKRVVNSLRSRGLKQTVVLAKNKLKKAKKPQLEKAHEVAADFKPLTINGSNQPTVSIVVPVYNQFKHTYHCLESLARLVDKTTFEVIVIDDCSTDETEQAIKQVTGIKYHRQPQNGGFIESCNTGASLAKGEYVVFLNNDTEVINNWLDELVLTFHTYPDAGLVGSQLLYPDGRLQEAGGIVFSDGSGWNYGRLDSPNAPEYQHLREATYISGASIMLRTEHFFDLGQFDQRYKPAYYEDTDLAFKVRQAGLKVYYQPMSKVIHFEGISSGTDLTSGTKKYQVINQQKFLEKWQAELQRQPNPGADIELARFQNKPKRVLIFDACTPTPDQDSGSLRMMNLMKIFIDLGHQVSFVPENMAHFKNYTQDLQRMGVNCIYAPEYPTAVAYLKAKGSYYETVILSRYYVANPILPLLKTYCSEAQIWFDTVDLHYLRETRMAELAHDKAALKAAKDTKNKELYVAENSDLTLVVSPYEQQVLASERPDLNVAVLSNIHEVYGGHVGHQKSAGLLFIGGYQHTPNVDGLLWFVEQIFPTILKAIPDVVLHVVGSKAPPEIIALGDQPNIKYHGFVEDIEPLMQQTRIAVAPLRFGAGVKGKVNMSMSYGQPVVGTKVAVEGMYTQHRHDVIMADDAQTFAAGVIELYEDPKLWQKIADGGIKNVEKWFSFNAAKKVITALLLKQ